MLEKFLCFKSCSGSALRREFPGGRECLFEGGFLKAREVSRGSLSSPALAKGQSPSSLGPWMGLPSWRTSGALQPRAPLLTFTLQGPHPALAAGSDKAEVQGGGSQLSGLPPLPAWALLSPPLLPRVLRPGFPLPLGLPRARPGCLPSSSGKRSAPRQ